MNKEKLSVIKSANNTPNSVPEPYPYKYEDVQGTTDILAVFRDLEQAFREKHEEMTRMYNKVVTSLQIPDEVKQDLLDEERPANAYNFITRLVRTLVSLENAHRKNVQAFAITDEDNRMAWVVTKTLQYFLRQAKFDYARTRAAIDAIITGYGIVYNQWSYADDPEGSEIITPRDPRTIYFEPSFADVSLQKSRYVIERFELTIEEIIDRYALENETLQKEIIMKFADYYYRGDKTKKKRFLSTLIERFLHSVGDVLAIDYRSVESNDDKERMFKDWVNPTTGRFTVLEVHERRSERRVILYFPEINEEEDITEQVYTEDGITFDQEKINAIANQRSIELGARVFPKTEIRKRLWLSAWLPAFNLKLADTPYPHDNNGNFAYTLLPMNDFHADMLNATGIIEEVSDLQDDYNKARNLELEFLARVLSKGYIYEDGAIDGFEEYWQSRKIGQLKPVNAGYWEKVKPEEDFNIPNEVFKITSEIPVLIEQISTVTRALFGQQEYADESGRMFIAKKNQAERGFMHFFDNIDRFTVQVAKNVWADIQHFVDEERVLRITSDYDKPEYLTINQKQVFIEDGRIVERVLNDITVGKYDIAIDESPYTPTAKELEYLKLVDTIQVIGNLDPQLAVKFTPVLIKASNTNYREDMLRILNEAEQASQQDPIQQIQIQMLQLELQLKEAEIEKVRAEAANKMADARSKGGNIQEKLVELEIKRAELQKKLTELREKLLELQAGGKKTALDIENRNLDLMNKRADLLGKRFDMRGKLLDNQLKASKVNESRAKQLNLGLDARNKIEQLKQSRNPLISKQINSEKK